MAEGDEHAGSEFVLRHQRRIFGIALAITTDAALAEEVARKHFSGSGGTPPSSDPRKGNVSSWIGSISLQPCDRCESRMSKANSRPIPTMPCVAQDDGGRRLTRESGRQ